MIISQFQNNVVYRNNEVQNSRRADSQNMSKSDLNTDQVSFKNKIPDDVALLAEKQMKEDFEGTILKLIKSYFEEPKHKLEIVPPSHCTLDAINDKFDPFNIINIPEHYIEKPKIIAD